MIMKSLALVAVFIYVTEASLIDSLGLEKRGARSCERFLSRCARPLMRYANVFNDFNSGAQFAESDVMDQLCGDLQSFTACSANAGDRCKSEEISNELEALTGLVNYMCSTRGRAVIVEMAESPCATDPSKQMALMEGFQVCYNDFEMEMNLFIVRAMSEEIDDPLAHMCPLLDEFKVCTIQGIGDLCGDAYRTFMAEMWEVMAGTQFAELGCGPQSQVARRLVTRAVTLLKRR